MKRYTFWVLSFLIVSSLVLAACQPAVATTAAPTTKPAATAAPTVAKPKTGGTLRIGTNQDPSVLGYTPMSTNNSFIQYLRTAFNSLTYYDSKGNMTPELATSWEVNPAGKTITYNLREGVKFHDGTAFDAEAVKWNIEEYQKNKRTEVANIESIDVVDKKTVTLHLIKWNSSNLEGIGFFVYYMSPTAVKANGADWAKQNPVGTGPFKLVEWKPGVSMKYTKNPDYWEKGKPYLDGVQFSIITDATTSSNSLQAGDLDLVSYVAILEVKNLEATGKFVRETNENGVGVESTGVLPNSNDPKSPFYEAKVRQAFAYAIDGDSLIKTLGYGYMKATNQWAAPGSKTYNPDVQGYPYNPTKAKELLAAAGFANGFDTTVFTAAGDDMMPAIATMLNQVGIRAKVELVDGTKLNSFMGNGWDGVMYHWASIGPDLGLYMGRHLDPTGAYFAKGIQHPEDTLALLEAIRTAPDEASKLKSTFELQKLIYDKYALFGKILYVTPINTMKYPYVKDDHWTEHAAAAWTPADAWLDK